jgi:hypothetical protein
MIVVMVEKESYDRLRSAVWKFVADPYMVFLLEQYYHQVRPSKRHHFEVDQTKPFYVRKDAEKIHFQGKQIFHEDEVPIPVSVFYEAKKLARSKIQFHKNDTINSPLRPNVLD